jgi:hypothetical protein
MASTLWWCVLSLPALATPQNLDWLRCAAEGTILMSQIGGSYATVPAIAGRKSFRNWYQANYRFSFVGARVAYDA